MAESKQHLKYQEYNSCLHKCSNYLYCTGCSKKGWHPSIMLMPILQTSGLDDTHHWAREQGTDLPLAMTTEVIQDCEVCAVVKEAWQRKLTVAYT